MQVDTLCHRIPGFIEKGVKAGIDNVFVGMENINPDNLAAVKKSQNRLLEYREMFLAWKKHPVVITAGYIIGFPNDTRESILRDVDMMKRELPIDLIYFTNLTPLPGCEDHQRMHRATATWMDPDLNKYDLNHRVTHHQKMSDEEWDKVYAEVWHRFYSFDHIETIFKRMKALALEQEADDPAPAALVSRLPPALRLPSARGRPRPAEIPPRPPLRHEAREPASCSIRNSGPRRSATSVSMIWTYRRMKKMLDAIWNDPASASYTDIAITRAGRGRAEPRHLPDARHRRGDREAEAADQDQERRARQGRSTASRCRSKRRSKRELQFTRRHFAGRSRAAG